MPNPIAQLRKDKSFIYPQPTEEDGSPRASYRDLNGVPGLSGKDYIMLGASGESDPADIFDILKHELVHKYLKGVQLPDEHAPYREQKGLFNANLNLTPNFIDANRAGSLPIELPAYTTIHQPRYTPSISEKEAQDYFGTLQNFLKTIGREDVSNNLMHLRDSRAAYNNNGLFPTKNVDMLPEEERMRLLNEEIANFKSKKGKR